MKKTPASDTKLDTRERIIEILGFAAIILLLIGVFLKIVLL
jgi:hypothetical protein